MSICGFAVFAHGQASFTQDISHWEFLLVFCIAFVEQDDCLPMVDVLDNLVDAFGVVGFIGKKGTRGKREKSVGTFQGYRKPPCCWRHPPLWSSRTGAVQKYNHQNVIFVSPVELGTLLILLIGGRMNAKATVQVVCGMIILAEFVLCKGFWTVELRLCRHRGGV